MINGASLLPHNKRTIPIFPIETKPLVFKKQFEATFKGWKVQVKVFTDVVFVSGLERIDYSAPLNFSGRFLPKKTFKEALI